MIGRAVSELMEKNWWVDLLVKTIAGLIALTYPAVAGSLGWLFLDHIGTKQHHSERLTKIESSRYTIEMGAIEQRERIEADAQERDRRTQEDQKIREEINTKYSEIISVLHGIDNKVTRLETKGAM